MSTVIKAAATARPPQGIAFNFEDMTQQAKEYLDQVRLRAGQIVLDAQKEAEAIRRKAEEDGRQAAMRAAESVLDQKVGKRMETLLPALRKAGEEIQQAKQAWLGQWESSAVKLATMIAGRVVRREIARCPEITVALVREALQLAAGSSQIRVHLNPADHATLGAQIASIATELSRAAPAEIIADPAVTPGGCRVATKHGSIDQQIETQLARIEHELLGKQAA